MLQICPYCQNLVVFDATGVCPVCRNQVVVEARGQPSAEEWAARAEAQAIGAFRRRLLSLTPHLYVVPLIVVANVALFVVMAVMSGAGVGIPKTRVLLEWGANFGPFTTGSQAWRLFTAMFVHIGVVHLGFNMWALWNLGRLTERFLGNAGLAVLYLVSGLAASVTSILWNPGVVSAGASGAVFGVLGGLMGFLILRRDSAPRSLRAELQRVGWNFLVCNAAIALIPGIDWAAHAGGFVAGFLCGAILSQPMDRVTPGRRAVRNAVTLVVGLAAVALGFVAVSQRPLDRRGVLTLLGLAEEPAVKAYNEIHARLREHQIDDAQFADLVDREVVAPWAEAVAHFSQLKPVREADQPLAELCRRYLEARVMECAALADAIRKQDAELFARHRRHQAEADELASRLKKELER